MNPQQLYALLAQLGGMGSGLGQATRYGINAAQGMQPQFQYQPMPSVHPNPMMDRLQNDFRNRQYELPMMPNPGMMTQPYGPPSWADQMNNQPRGPIR